MIKVDEINNLPQEVIDGIKIPKRSVVFVLHNIPIKDGKPRYPNSRGVPNRDLILIDGKVHEIGFLLNNRKNGAGQYNFGDIWFDGRKMGRIQLFPSSKIQDRNLYMYLTLCNYNVSNPNRDESYDAIFKLENSQEDARKEIAKIEQNTLANSTAIKLDKPDIRKMAEFYGFDATKHPDILQLALIKQADKNPEAFMEAIAYVAKSGHHLEVVRKALRHDVISIDQRGGFKWRWSDTKEVFHRGNKDESKEKNIFSLAEWLRNNDNGKKVCTTIENQLVTYETEYKLD